MSLLLNPLLLATLAAIITVSYTLDHGQREASFYLCLKCKHTTSFITRYLYLLSGGKGWERW